MNNLYSLIKRLVKPLVLSIVTIRTRQRNKQLQRLAALHVDSHCKCTLGLTPESRELFKKQGKLVYDNEINMFNDFCHYIFYKDSFLGATKQTESFYDAKLKDVESQIRNEASLALFLVD